MSSQDATPPVWDANRLRIATDAAGIALRSWNVETNSISMDERAHGLWDVPAGEAVTFEDLSARIHPEILIGFEPLSLRPVKNLGPTRSTSGFCIAVRCIGYPLVAGDKIKALSAGLCSVSSST